MSVRPDWTRDVSDALVRAARRDVGAWRRLGKAEELRRRQIPSLPIGPRTGSPTVYYLLPDHDRPQGGVRVAYRHVDALNEMGWSAAILHRNERSRAEWFEHSTRMVFYANAGLKEDDILVVPEWFGPSMPRIDERLRSVVLNQGAYITFDALPLDSTMAGAPYRQMSRLEGITTVSRDSAKLLGLAFPDIPLDIVRPVVDGAIFRPGNGTRTRSIACVPSRRPEELHLLLHLLRAMGVDWPLVPIRGRSEVEVARMMQQSMIFISLSERDGFGLPPAEAMACGAYVIGFTGGGGDEFFDPEYSVPVTTVSELAEAVRDATALPPAELARRGLLASDAILAQYHEAGMREDLRLVYERMLGAPGASP